MIQAFKLILNSLIYRMQAGTMLEGQDFDLFGRKKAFTLLFSGDKSRFLQMICNPVSMVRYFEFPFTHNAVNWQSISTWLDISSPRLLLSYLLSKYAHLKVVAINPDQLDLSETKYYLDKFNLLHRANLQSCYAEHLPFKDNSFDLVTSISVIEHIPNENDLSVIKEIWRVLRPRGKLVLTIPCFKEYFEEWRDSDPYGLLAVKKGDKYFFQRFYDDNAIQIRISNIIGCSPIHKVIFGEKVKGTFFEYEKRWIKLGLEETIKDPLYIVNDYQYFAGIDNLPGMGVCGLVYQKSEDK